MLETFCTFALLYLVVSIIWPDRRSDRAAGERKHKEVLEAIAKLERQNATLPPPLPTHNSAERARVLALGKIRDGAKRHPILDTPYVSVADPREDGSKKLGEDYYPVSTCRRSRSNGRFTAPSRDRPARSSGFEAPDETSALEAAIEEFGIINPEHQSRLFVRRVPGDDD